MKYITTEKHPELKEGLIIEMYSEGHANGTRYSTSQGLYILEDHQLACEHELGYIKEVEEKEFTKSDMIDFGKFFNDRIKDGNYQVSWEDRFKDWKKEITL